MPVFFQHAINATTRLGIWKIEEAEDFFKGNVRVQREVTHPHKRLQHLAGRFLLQYLYPAFPYDLIRIADTRKPYVEDEAVHFSISHCGDYAAAIISTTDRVGIDIEIPVPKILRIQEKFLGETEIALLSGNRLQTPDYRLPALLWSAKESMFKWYGKGHVDFRKDMQIRSVNPANETMDCFFAKTGTALTVQYRMFDEMILAWVISPGV